MTESPQQLGPYTITRELGRGGMGVVYLARDTRLDRDVAVKALPDELAQDSERLARFEREARTLAQLNHPNVAGIHGVEEAENRKYLVLEYVEGETLADRLDRGPIPVDEAIELAVQIAAGVEAAHEAGVIHRDLKPGNIIITPDGQAKVLDFGLARTEESQGSSTNTEAATLTSPAIQHSPTMPGVILGTAAYMSPEQARGRKVDKRTDIWSFGVLLYEMLTGASPFVGETVSDSIGAILHKDIDLDQLPPRTSALVRHVLRRCIERDKAHRYRDIGDVRIELTHAHDHPVADARHSPGGRRAGPAIAWTIAALSLVAAGFLALGPTLFSRDEEPPARFEADLLPGDGLDLAQRLSPVRLSPDGQSVAYLAYREDGEWALCVRDLRTGAERILEGPERPISPCWSPDGEYIAYLSDDRIERIAADGGRVEFVARFTDSHSELSLLGDWGEDGRFFFSSIRGPIKVFDPRSGVIETAIDPVPDRDGDWGVLPQLLPDGEHVLYLNQDDFTADIGVYVGSLTDGASKMLLPTKATAQYIEPGWLIFRRAGDLHRQRFDPDKLELVGHSERIAGPVFCRDWPAVTAFSATPETLVYVLDSEIEDTYAFSVYDIESGDETRLGVTGNLWEPAISPDGAKIAFDRTRDATSGDIAVYDIERAVESTLSRHHSNETGPVWSPDQRHVYFLRGADIYRVESDGTSAPERVVSGGVNLFPEAVINDGRRLTYSVRRDSIDLLSVGVDGGESEEFVATGADESSLSIDPSGRWATYQSSASGEPRIMVISLTGAAPAIPVTRGMGHSPVWIDDRIFFDTQDNIVAVSVTENPDGRLVFGEPQPILPNEGVAHFDAFPDGKRLLLNRYIKPTSGGRMRVVRNWQPPSSALP